MSVGAKRRQAQPLRFDDKLQRVAHALENAARVGALGASGSSARFPPPGLAFAGDNDDDELSFPLSRHAAETLKPRARVTQSLDGMALAWEVDDGSLEARNPRWQAFLTDRFDEMRAALGVSTAAKVELSLRKLALVGTGGVLTTQSEGQETRRDGLFATLVVALPGPCEGGSVTCHEDGEGDSKEHKAFVWAPGARSNRYDLTYAVIYNHTVVETAPIARGEALVLVYDVTTTTPSEVPLFGGPAVLQRSVDAVLRDYFDATPAPLAKRLRISTDAWGTINEFVSKRHFVYMVNSKTFEGLSEKERTLAKYLAGFCANSGGRYALYLTAVLCSRETEKHTGSGEVSRLLEEDGVLHLTLKSPWLKYGEAAPSELPSVRVRQEHHVVPLGHAEDVELFVKAYGTASDDLAIINKIHGNHKRTGVATTYALVVVPASVEQQQLAKVPIGEATAKLKSLLSESPEQALEYARQVLRFRSPWTLSNIELREFHAFTDAIIAINDLDLFKETVRSVILTDNVQPGFFHAAVDHFGWDACAETLVERILTMTSVRGRINLVTAVVDTSSDATRINRLLVALVSQHPWTSRTVTGPSVKSCCGGSFADVFCFAELLLVANVCSNEKLSEIVSVTCSVALIELVIPALGRLKEQLDLATLRPIVQDLTARLHRVKTLASNAAFATVRIQPDCRDCEGLQDFLRSNVVEMIMPIVGAGLQVQHLQAVLSRQLRHRNSVTVQSAGANAVRLTRSSDSVSSPSMVSAESVLRELSEAIDERHRREAW